MLVLAMQFSRGMTTPSLEGWVSGCRGDFGCPTGSAEAAVLRSLKTEERTTVRPVPSGGSKLQALGFRSN